MATIISTRMLLICALVAIVWCEDCVDQKTLCLYWARQSYCETNSAYMMPTCNAACNSTCTTQKMTFNCTDGKRQCKQWKEAGNCEKKLDYMVWMCPKTCGFCDKNETKDYPPEIKTAMANVKKVTVTTTTTPTTTASTTATITAASSTSTTSKAADTAKQGSDVAKQGCDASKQVTDESKQVPDAAKQKADAARLGPTAKKSTSSWNFACSNEYNDIIQAINDLRKITVDERRKATGKNKLYKPLEWSSDHNKDAIARANSCDLTQQDPGETVCVQPVPAVVTDQYASVKETVMNCIKNEWGVVQKGNIKYSDAKKTEPDCVDGKPCRNAIQMMIDLVSDNVGCALAQCDGGPRGLNCEDPTKCKNPSLVLICIFLPVTNIWETSVYGTPGGLNDIKTTEVWLLDEDKKKIQILNAMDSLRKNAYPSQPKLAWSTELSESAKSRAATCNLWYQDAFNDETVCGRTVPTGTLGDAVIIGEALKCINEVWGGPAPDSEMNSVVPGQPASCKPGTSCRNYMQVLEKEVKGVGCAVAKCKGASRGLNCKDITKCRDPLLVFICKFDLKSSFADMSTYGSPIN